MSIVGEVQPRSSAEARIKKARVFIVRVATPNDLKLSDRRAWRDRCAAGRKGGGREQRA